MASPLARIGPALLRVGAAGLVAAAAWPAGAADEAAAQFALGRKLFATGTVPACTVCHTLKDAGSEGAVGPVLDELKPDASRVAAAVRNGVGAMPSFQAALSEAEIAALARYVAVATGAAK
jgi:sulfite dehydrogenase